jgi:hypothetical protein
LAASIAWLSFHSADNTPSANAATAGFTTAPDKGYTDLLASAGHTVTRVVGADSFNTALLASYDLVIVSRSSASTWFDAAAETAAWNTFNKPIIFMSGYALRNNRLGLYTGATIPDTTGNIKLKTTITSHPIFNTVSLDGAGQMVNDFAGRVTFAPTATLQNGISVITNAPIAGAQSLATVGASDGAGDTTIGGTTIGFFPAGLTTASATPNVLGARRMAFLSGSRENGITSEGAGIFDLTATGATVFKNAVNWMVTVPEPTSCGLAIFALAGFAGLRRKR